MGFVLIGGNEMPKKKETKQNEKPKIDNNAEN